MGVKFNKKEFARLIGLSERAVHKMMDKGMPYEGGGRGNPLTIDSEEAIRWMIRQEVAKVTGFDEGEDGFEEGTKAHEEFLLLKAKREIAEVERDEVKKLSIKIEQVTPIILNVATIYAQSLDALSSRVASEFADIDDPAIIKQRILEESRDIRAATAGRLRDYVSRSRGDIGDDSGCDTT